jgi:hypothetical protein
MIEKKNKEADNDNKFYADSFNSKANKKQSNAQESGYPPFYSNLEGNSDNSNENK